MAPVWVGSLTEDLCSGVRGLDEFLWAYGPEAPQQGSDVPVLTRLYRDVSGGEAPDQVFAYLTSIYGAAEEMPQLKQDLLGPSSKLWTLDENDRLRLCLQYAASVPWNELDVASRLRRLLRKKPVDAIEILLSGDHKSSYRQEVLSDVSSDIDANLVMRITIASPETAAVLLSINPAPLGEPELWVKGGEPVRQLLDALAQVDIQIPVHPFADVAEGRVVNHAVRAGVVPLREAIDVVGSDATDSALERWREVFEGLVRETQRELKTKEDNPWQPVALALAASGAPDHALIQCHAMGLAEHFEEMGEIVRLRVAAAIFSLGGKRAVEHWATGRSFATLHKAPPKELRRANVSDLLSSLARNEKPRPALREELVRIVVEEDWSERDIAWALHDAGPGARKVKDYTPKKSDLRKAVNAGWKMAAKGVDLAIKKLGG
jgi:hypothetical protein